MDSTAQIGDGSLGGLATDRPESSSRKKLPREYVRYPFSFELLRLEEPDMSKPLDVIRKELGRLSKKKILG